MNSFEAKLDRAPELLLVKGVDEKNTFAPGIGTPAG
jgi:hypothetical protein